ncbi:MAG: M1 family metallopeptidase [Rhodothermales bacterium]|nr:M1 family metallopeptidase [Rhodothermales bacterium]
MRFLSLSLLLALVVAEAPAQHTYTDSYPKNSAIDVQNYVFELSLSDESDVIRGRTTVDARFKEPVSELRLDLISISADLDGKGMMVTGVEMAGEPLSWQHENDALVIQLAASMAGRHSVVVEYQGIPAAGLRIGPNKYGDRTFFSDNWSSRVRNWVPTVDHPYDKAANEFVVTAPSHYQVVSNGLRIEETDLGGGQRMTHWKNSVPTATWLYFLGVAEFAMQQVDAFEGKAIEIWVYRQDREDGFHDFAIPSKQVLAYYSDLIGPYAYERLANVVSPATGGGMEAASTPAYSERSVTGDRSRRWQHVIIHEIAHQWFGNSVTEYHWNDVWLSEGFATYYTLLFREYAYGHDDFIAGLKDSRQRVANFYQDDWDFQLVRPYIEDLNDVSGAMMYQKGAWILHMLRELLGSDTYHAGVRAYYAEHFNGHAQTADFQRAMEEASGMDLAGYFDQWLFQGGIPRLAVSWSQDDGTLTIGVEQTQEAYRFNVPLEVDVHFDEGDPVRLVMDLEKEGSSSISESFDREVTRVEVDPDTRLLASWEIN